MSHIIHLSSPLFGVTQNVKNDTFWYSVMCCIYEYKYITPNMHVRCYVFPIFTQSQIRDKIICPGKLRYIPKVKMQSYLYVYRLNEILAHLRNWFKWTLIFPRMTCSLSLTPNFFWGGLRWYFLGVMGGVCGVWHANHIEHKLLNSNLIDMEVFSPHSAGIPDVSYSLAKAYMWGTYRYSVIKKLYVNASTCFS